MPEAEATRLELYLLRHADAGDPMAWEGDDAARPLSGRGRKQARRMGRWLADLGRRPDAILTSPKLRALETAKLVGEALGMEPTVDPRLASGFDEAALDALVADARGRDGDVGRLMVVGHDPDFSDLASSLSGGAVALKKGALARIDLEGPTSAGGLLRWLMPAEAIPDR